MITFTWNPVVTHPSSIIQVGPHSYCMATSPPKGPPLLIATSTASLVAWGFKLYHGAALSPAQAVASWLHVLVEPERVTCSTAIDIDDICSSSKRLLRVIY